MRRLTIAFAVYVFATAVAAPAASAEKATFSGTCAITGVSTFDPPLTGMNQTIKYDFKSGPPADGVEDGTVCSGTLNGKSVSDVPVKASVAGEGDLSCASGESTTPGSGALVFPDGSKFPFAFTFTAILTEVDFTATFQNGVETAGHASFMHYAPPTTVFDCSPAGSGIEALGFDATTDASATPVEGTKPDARGEEPRTEERPSTPQEPGTGERPATPDETSPKVTLSGKKSQPLGKTVSVRVKSNEAGEAISTGRLSVPNASKVYRLVKASKAVEEGEAVTLKLRLSRAARKAARGALEDGEDLAVKVKVVTEDGAGNTTTKRRAISLKLP